MTDQATAAMMEKAREIAAACTAVMWGSGSPDTLEYKLAYESALAALASQAEIVGELVGALEEAETYFGPFAEITVNGQYDNEDVRVVRLIRTTLARARSAGL